MGVEMGCDVKGCHRPACVEVFPLNGTWSYLCKKHYKKEYEEHRDNYGWYKLSIAEKILVVIRVYK